MGKKLRYQSVALSLVLLVSLVLSGCRNLADALGHYEGTLQQRYSDGIRSTQVSIDLSRSDRASAAAEVRDLRGNRLFFISAQNVRLTTFDLLLPPPWRGFVHMRKDQECFVGERPRVTLCFSGSKVLLDLTDGSGQSLFTITGDKFKREAPIEMETPRTFTLNEAIHPDSAGQEL